MSAASHPDAELIELCANYEATEREILALYEPDDTVDDETDASLKSIHEKLAPILERMEEGPSPNSGR